ncbi:MAG: hypothetical protein P4L53_05215 [Candidatus Obscuribacterales bacterium]|nr:hypothetical protein [Candidatus Obscuribacterales bacterium]
MKTATKPSTLDICAGVVGACSSRRVASPDLGNYFVDPLRSLGMVRPEQPDETGHRNERPFELEGIIEIDPLFGTARLR